MSTAEILSLVSLISFILAGVCLVVALFLWFFFKIPGVIGDLSGRTARKSIEKMRQANASTGNKSYRSSAANVARGKLTDTIPGSAASPKQAPQAPKPTPAPVQNGQPETSLLSDNQAGPVISEETTALTGCEETDILTENNVLIKSSQMPVRRTGGKQLTMINSVMLIHTNEVI